jgi:hypothetical protein
MGDIQEVRISWRTSTRSNGTNCIEVASRDGSAVLVRDSKNRDGILSVSPTTWQNFIASIQLNHTT